MKGVLVLVVSCWPYVVLAQQAEPAGGKVFQMPQSPSAGAQPLYYLTRITPNGSEERVTPPYVFPVNSKAYLNVLPTEDGHLAVLADQQLYFPFSKKATADPDLVKKGETIKVPIVFDDKPGETKFTVAIIPEGNDIRSESILDAVHRNERAQAGIKLQNYLNGGKGVKPPSDDDLPKVTPPVIWNSFSLRNK